MDPFHQQIFQHQHQQAHDTHMRFHHQMVSDQNHLFAMQTHQDMSRMQSNTRALKSANVSTAAAFGALLIAMGIYKAYKYSTESKVSLLDMFAKGALIAGKALMSYFTHLEDQLTEMTVETTNLLDQYDEYVWDFGRVKSSELIDTRVIISDIPLQTMFYLKTNPVRDIPRLIHETELIIDLVNVLTGSMYERIAEIDTRSDKTSEVLTMMRLMKSIDTTRNYLGNRRIDANFNYAESLKLTWSAIPTRTKNVEYIVDLDSFKEMSRVTRLIVRTIKTAKETLKLSKTQYGTSDTPVIRDSVVNKLYVPLLLDLVKLKDVYMLMMSKYVAQNKGFIK